MNKLTSKAPVAFRLALVMGLGIGTLAAQPASTTTAPADASKAEKLEKFEVTGSRIAVARQMNSPTP